MAEFIISREETIKKVVPKGSPTYLDKTVFNSLENIFPVVEVCICEYTEKYDCRTFKVYVGNTPKDTRFLFEIIHTYPDRTKDGIWGFKLPWQEKYKLFNEDFEKSMREFLLRIHSGVWKPEEKQDV